MVPFAEKVAKKLLVANFSLYPFTGIEVSFTFLKNNKTLS